LSYLITNKRLVKVKPFQEFFHPESLGLAGVDFNPAVKAAMPLSPADQTRI
jgi:hypothetical protein